MVENLGGGSSLKVISHRADEKKQHIPIDENPEEIKCLGYKFSHEYLSPHS